MPLPSHGDLRLRYLDWCSAKVAERFQELSVDEVWERAQQSLGTAPPLGESSSLPASPGYLDLVRELSIQLADELGLPSFQEWTEAYSRDPEPFEREIIGFGASRTLQEPTR